MTHQLRTDTPVFDALEREVANARRADEEGPTSAARATSRGTTRCAREGPASDRRRKATSRVGQTAFFSGRTPFGRIAAVVRFLAIVVVAMLGADELFRAHDLLTADDLLPADDQLPADAMPAESVPPDAV